MWERVNIPLQIESYEKKIAIWEIIVSYTQEVTEGNFINEVPAQIESKTFENIQNSNRWDMPTMLTTHIKLYFQIFLTFQVIQMHGSISEHQSSQCFMSSSTVLTFCV